jgi:hypothetical protein
MALVERYHIRLQPDVGRTLNDSGVLDFDINLTRDHVYGIIAMVNGLFPDDPNRHLVIENARTYPYFIVTRYISEPFAERLHSYLRYSLSWRDAIAATFPESISIILPYSALLTNMDGLGSRFVNLTVPSFSKVSFRFSDGLTLTHGRIIF